ncbi:MAG: phosphotransferase [Calditrichaeota bacterium]|nr:phosphotransferase [Calditrichota bacterium]
MANLQQQLPDVLFTNVAVYIGTSGSANQKLTIQLMDHINAVVGFVKIADKSIAKAFLENEFKALQRIGGLQLPDVVIPRKQRLFHIDDTTCLYQDNSFESGTDCGYAIDERISNAATTIARQTSDATSLDDFYAGKSRQYKALPLDSGIIRALQQAIDQLSAANVPSVSVHGDFVPYNIKLKPGGIALIDWEFYQERGFPLYDLFTFVYQGGVHILNQQPAALINDIRDPHSANGRYIQQYLKELTIDSALLKPLLMLCLAEGLWMYLSLRSDADPVNNHFTAGLLVLNNEN